MGIFNDRSKRALVGAMRECVCDTLMESATLTSKQATDKMNFIFENATYEQLLNITINPNRDTNYLPSYVLEGAVAILHRACLTGREYIGKNAITEGAKLLAEETGAVVTESMKEAALNSVNNGNGLKVVTKLLEEAVILNEAVDMLSSLFNGTATRNQIRQFMQVQAQMQSGLNFNQAIQNVFATPAERTAFINTLKPEVRRAIGSGTPINSEFIRNVYNTTRISQIERELAEKAAGGGFRITGADREARKALLEKLRGRSAGGTPFRSAANKINPAMYQDVSRTLANQPKRMNPWVAGGLGIAGALGGAYLYNRYKQNQAAQQQ